MFSLCHPWFTTTNLSYTFPILETSATASCGSTGKNCFFRKSEADVCRLPPRMEKLSFDLEQGVKGMNVEWHLKYDSVNFEFWIWIIWSIWYELWTNYIIFIFILFLIWMIRMIWAIQSLCWGFVFHCQGTNYYTAFCFSKSFKPVGSDMLFHCKLLSSALVLSQIPI